MYVCGKRPLLKRDITEKERNKDSRSRNKNSRSRNKNCRSKTGTAEVGTVQDGSYRSTQFLSVDDANVVASSNDQISCMLVTNI